MMQIVRDRIAALLADADPDVRRRAAEELATARGLAALAGLAAALEDESKGVRDAAARSLCTIGGINVARAIVEHIGHENIITRNLSAELLVKLGRIAIPALLPYLEHENQDIRKISVDILGLIGSSEPTPHMLPLLGDPDANVVVSVVEALGNMRSVQSLPFLYETYDRDEYTRPAVAEALGKIGDHQAEGFLLERLRQSLRTAGVDPLTPFAIIEALGVIGDATALTALCGCIPEVQGRVRSALLHAVVQIAERAGMPLPVLSGMRKDFLRAFHEDDVQLRISGAKWLSPFTDPDITRMFIRVLGMSPDLDAMLVPALMKRQEVFAAATEELNTIPPGQRRAVITLLGRLVMEIIQRVMRHSGERFDERLFGRAFDSIASLWETSDEETRGAIVDALFRLDGDRAVEFLDAIMNDPDPWLRMHVIEVIAAIADRRAPDFIVRFLEDDDEMVRELALGTLQAKGFDVATI
jgi:HEAT repeat protein